MLPAGQFLGFVEGVNFELTNTFANVEVFASDESLLDLQDPLGRRARRPLTWGDVVATLQWQNA